MHPQDEGPDDEPAARLRTVYLGGAGVVDALHRLARRGFVALRRDYVPYVERSLEARPDFPGQDAERSLWMGEAGIRLVLQRVAPSQANLERLSELIAANEQDERCELVWGSPGTILAGRALGLDVTASGSTVAVTPKGCGRSNSTERADAFSAPHTGSPGACSRSATSPPSPRRSNALPSRRAGSSTGRHSRGCGSTTTATATSHAVVPWRAGNRRDTCPPPRRGSRGRRRRADVARRAASEGRQPVPWHGRERIRVPGAAPANRGRRLAQLSACIRDARRGTGGAQPVGVRARSLLALDGRPRHGPLPGRLHRWWRGATPPVDPPVSAAAEAHREGSIRQAGRTRRRRR